MKLVGGLLAPLGGAAGPAAEADGRASETLGDVLAGSSRPRIVTLWNPGGCFGPGRNRRRCIKPAFPASPMSQPLLPPRVARGLP